MSRSSSAQTQPLPGRALASLPATIPDLLAIRRSSPGDPFLIGPDFRLTFGQADARSHALAGRLMAAGVGKGSRVGFLYPNGPAWAITWLALTRIGALSVPFSTFAPAVELARTLRHTDVTGLLTASRFAGESLPDRLEVGLSGLVDSGPELALSDVPYLRWIHIEDERRPVSRVRCRHHYRMRWWTQRSRRCSRLIPWPSSTRPGATAAPKAVVHSHGSLVRHGALLARHCRGLCAIHGPDLFADAVLLGRRNDHGSAQRPPLWGSRVSCRSGSTPVRPST